MPYDHDYDDQAPTTETSRMTHLVPPSPAPTPAIDPTPHQVTLRWPAKEAPGRWFILDGTLIQEGAHHVFEPTHPTDANVTELFKLPRLGGLHSRIELKDAYRTFELAEATWPHGRPHGGPRFVLHEVEGIVPSTWSPREVSAPEGAAAGAAAKDLADIIAAIPADAMRGFDGGPVTPLTAVQTMALLWNNLPTVRGVYASILAERAAQDRQWGGPAHDDTHSFGEWIGWIRDFCAKARQTDQFSVVRRRLVQIAALAVAAVESLDRKEERLAPLEPLPASPASRDGEPAMFKAAEAKPDIKAGEQRRDIQISFDGEAVTLASIKPGPGDVTRPTINGHACTVECHLPDEDDPRNILRYSARTEDDTIGTMRHYTVAEAVEELAAELALRDASTPAPEPPGIFEMLAKRGAEVTRNPRGLVVYLRDGGEFRNEVPARFTTGPTDRWPTHMSLRAFIPWAKGIVPGPWVVDLTPEEAARWRRERWVNRDTDDLKDADLGTLEWVQVVEREPPAEGERPLPHLFDLLAKMDARILRDPGDLVVNLPTGNSFATDTWPTMSGICRFMEWAKEAVPGLWALDLTTEEVNAVPQLALRPAKGKKGPGVIATLRGVPVVEVGSANPSPSADTVTIHYGEHRIPARAEHYCFTGLRVVAGDLTAPAWVALCTAWAESFRRRTPGPEVVVEFWKDASQKKYRVSGSEPIPGNLAYGMRLSLSPVAEVDEATAIMTGERRTIHFKGVNLPGRLQTSPAGSMFTADDPRGTWLDLVAAVRAAKAPVVVEMTEPKGPPSSHHATAVFTGGLLLVPAASMPTPHPAQAIIDELTKLCEREVMPCADSVEKFCAFVRKDFGVEGLTATPASPSADSTSPEELAKHGADIARRVAAFDAALLPMVKATLQRHQASFEHAVALVANAFFGPLVEQRDHLVKVALDQISVEVAVSGGRAEWVMEKLHILADAGLIPTAEGHTVIDPEEAFARVEVDEITLATLRDNRPRTPGAHRWVSPADRATRKAICSMLGEDVWGVADFTPEEAVMRFLVQTVASGWRRVRDVRDVVPTMRVVVEVAKRAVAHLLAKDVGLDVAVKLDDLPRPVEGKKLVLHEATKPAAAAASTGRSRSS